MNSGKHNYRDFDFYNETGTIGVTQNTDFDGELLYPQIGGRGGCSRLNLLVDLERARAYVALSSTTKSRFDKILIHMGPGELVQYDGDFQSLKERDPREIIWEGVSGIRLPLNEAVRLGYQFPSQLMWAFSLLAPEWLANHGWDEKLKEFAPNSIVPL